MVGPVRYLSDMKNSASIFSTATPHHYQEWFMGNEHKTKQKSKS